MSTDTCAAWNPSACEGTAGCPPRCPRFIDKHGRALLVEPASDRHREGLRAMYADYPDAHRSMGLPPIRLERIDTWLDALLETGTNLVARDGTRVVGHAAYAANSSAEPEFVIFVDPDYHDGGVGSELCRHTIATAAENGHEALTLDVDAANERAVHVYRKLGFRITGRSGGDLAMRLSFDEPIVDAVRLPPAERETPA
ncbi:GNAT family N-acetyltransferase [Saliphagus sp. GCM10025308]